MEIIKREIAYKVRIKDIVENKYVKEEGEWTPNYILVNDKKVSRVNIIGAVIAVPEGSLIINDGSESISIRSFEEKNFNVNIGDVILVIGRPREFNNEKYIMPEIVREIKDNKWIELRKLELGLLSSKEKKEYIIKTEEVIEDKSDKIFKLIKEIDKGEGADIQEVISQARINKAEDLIQNLLKEGEIFEIKPGKLKVLE